MTGKFILEQLEYTYLCRAHFNLLISLCFTLGGKAVHNSTSDITTGHL